MSSMFPALRSSLLRKSEKYNDQNEKISNMNKQSNSFSDIEHLELVARRIAESGTDLTGNYKDWMDITFACASLGEGARESYHLICSQYSGYKREECDEKFSNCLKSGRGAAEGVVAVAQEV